MYAVFGILTTIINTASYYFCYEVIHIPNISSTIIAWFLAVAFAFITNKLWVFDSPSFSKQVLVHEIPTFFGARIATGILDVAIMYMAVDIMTWPATLWKLISNGFVIILNYVASKLIIFTNTGKMKRTSYHILKDDNGTYYPGFFIITLNQEIKGSMDSSTFTEEQFATFVHEYIHYLQDISTTRGIYFFTHVSKLIQLYFHIGATRFKDVITLPLDLEKLQKDEHIDNVYSEYELFSFYQGTESYKKINHIKCIKREKEDCLDGIVSQDMYNINIYYDDKNNPYILGQIAITESMAYTIEHEAFGAKKRTKEFPYNACELICEKECPQLLKNKAVFVAAMELSLMHYHSGEMFWEIVKCMRDNNLEFDSVDAFAKYFIPRTCHLTKNMLEKYGEAQQCIDFLYPNSAPAAEEFFKEARAFETDKLCRGISRRQKNDLFIAELLEDKNPKQLFMKYINLFGLPITCDSTYAMYGTIHDGNITNLLGPIALYSIFDNKGEDNKCFMYPYCKASGNVSQCNFAECTKHPWTQANKDETCVFGVYWHMYSLDGKSICRKNNHNQEKKTGRIKKHDC